MECSMCQELYEEKRLIPRNLPCGHTFCEYCLEQVVHLKGFIECPNCRRRLGREVAVDSLSKNFVALGLALKQRQLQAKLQMCPTHDEFKIFFCEDCNEHLCTSCIVQHSGHKFLRQEHSVQLLKERLAKVQETLVQSVKEAKDSTEEIIEMRVSHENYLQHQMERVDTEFDQLIEQVNQRRVQIKTEYTRLYSEFTAQIDLDAALHSSFAESLEHRLQSLVKMQQTLDATKVIKDDTLVKEIETIEEEANKAVKESAVHSGFAPQDIPNIVFGSEVYKHLDSFAYLDRLVAKMCFFGDKNTALIFDLNKDRWRKFELQQMYHLSFMSYGTAVPLPSGNIMIFGGGKSRGALEVCLKKGGVKINRRKDMPTARKEHSAVSLQDGTVIVLGGYDQSTEQMLNTCILYNNNLDSWTELPNMPTAKCAFAACVDFQGKAVYTFGGFDSEKRLDVIERFILDTKKWETLKVRLSKPLSNAAAVSTSTGNNQNSIFILGGGHDEGFSREVFKFTPTKDQVGDKLEVFAEMESGKDLRNKAAVHSHYLYAVGGNNYQAQRLNLKTKQWEQLSSYFPVVADNLDSWACALTFTSQRDEIDQEGLQNDQKLQIIRPQTPIDDPQRRYQQYIYREPHLQGQEQLLGHQQNNNHQDDDDDDVEEDIEDDEHDHGRDNDDDDDQDNHNIQEDSNIAGFSQRQYYGQQSFGLLPQNSNVFGVRPATPPLHPLQGELRSNSSFQPNRNPNILNPNRFGRF